MPQLSQIATHPMQAQIDRWLLAGKPARWVALQANPQVTHMAVHRYRTKLLGPALKRAAANLSSPAATSLTLQNQADRVNPFILRSNALWEESWDAVRLARQSVTSIEKPTPSDVAAMAPILSAATRTLELYGKGTGYLNDAAGAVTNVVIVQNYAAGAAQHDAQQASDDDGQVLDVVPEK